MSLIQAPSKYTKLKRNTDLVYDAICRTLSERCSQVNWDAFRHEDWNLFVQMAENEGVAPLLYYIGVKGGNPSVTPFLPSETPDLPTIGANCKQNEWPAEVQAALQASYYQITAHNTMIFEELKRILTAFDKANIPVMVLKGASLAQTIYPEAGLRPMGDLDLLVKFEQVSQAIRIFLDHGYKPLFITSHHIGFSKEYDSSLPIELHFEIPLEKQNKTLIPAEWFWDQKTLLTFNRQEISGLCQFNPTAQLIYLVCHLWLQHAAHRRLIWMYDVYRLINEQKNDIDWKMLEISIQKAHLGFEFDQTWKGLSTLFDLEIQSSFMPFSNKNSVETNEILNLRKQPGLSSTFKVIRAFDTKTQFYLLTHFIFFDKTKIISQYQPRPDWLWPLYLPHRWWDIGKSILQL